MKIKNKFSIPSKKIVVGLVLFFMVLVPFIYKLESGRLHGDENHWVYTTKYFKLFFIDKDVHNEQWREGFAFDQPPVGRYIIGLALVIAGYKDRFEEINKMSVWDFRKDYDWNVSNGALPPQDILYAARFSMAILGVLSCFLMFWVGRTAFNTSVGIMAALLLAYNPLMLLCCKRAMTDAPLLFFMTANVALIILFYSSLLKQNLFGTSAFAALIGIDIGLAAGTKLNGGLAGIIFAAFCILLVSIKIGCHRFSENHLKGIVNKLRTDREVKIIFGSLVISGLITTFVFVGLNPYLYHEPLKGSFKMVRHRMRVVESQQQHWVAITTLSQKSEFVVRKTLIDKSYTTLNYFINIPLDLGLFLFGLVMLLYTEGKYLFRHHKPSLKSIILIWTFLTFIGTMLWIPLDWDRYYLPIIPCVAMMVGYALERILNQCWRLAKSAVIKH